MNNKKLTEKVLKKIEKEFLGIRGWNKWEVYDSMGGTLDLDKNIRNELLNISINIAFAEKDAEANKQAKNNLKHINKMVTMALDVQKEKKDLFVKKLKGERPMGMSNNEWINKLNKEVFANERNKI